MKNYCRKLLMVMVTTIVFVSCARLDIPPVNLVTNEDIFTTTNGITAYFARMYSSLPLEDYRYSHNRAWNNERVTHNVGGITGEAVGRDTQMRPAAHWFQEGYALIRDVNVFISTLMEYANYHDPENVEHWIAEARMIRGFAYMTMAKRYGGVPIVNEVIDDYAAALLPRNSEEEVWDQISEDFQYAVDHMRGDSEDGRFNRYAAAAYKAHAMLHAASIANFSTIRHTDTRNGGALVCGIPAERAADYYRQAYEATKIVDEGGYSLYMNEWQEGNAEAQYNNFMNLYQRVPNSESIFVRYFRYPELPHSWDAIYGPLQYAIGGLSGGLTPSYDLVSEFDGIGDFVDENNRYILYDNTMGPFEHAEPRLRATVILPGDSYKGSPIEVYRGIYTGTYPVDGLTKLYDINDNFSLYNSNPNLLTSISNIEQQYYTLPNGQRMRAAGLSGAFSSENRGSRTGFHLRKLLDPTIPPAEVDNFRSESDWVDMRYAEVLLTRAEAAYELHELGQDGGNYIEEAFEAVQLIRRRAGANLMAGSAELNRETIRRERRKELAFESKAYWDQVRWRVFSDMFPDNPVRRLKGALAFYVPSEDKWFFDVKGVELGNADRVFQELWYYVDIPADQISRNPMLIQNPGY
ncbi:RagB/SusD family nutrient uptake outer membrane protein [Parapedobacter koreensis]|uniref:Starch-binding associating with outer membrane n=1 Tax=Parapedobacter koreensis TaxID=332977 RepID=A0A1H7RQR7_9SPHI|nr:RagB/SusD family nutrient uptake outer membrane protein [Parapedobacter koreensis]SEL62359.1 Starch-binding associating with outer membrane [Parapedobacter koreensis]